MMFVYWIHISYKQVAKGEPPQQPICILNIVLPETILPESTLSEPDLLILHKKYSFLRDGGLGKLMFP
jgi:ankyrin